MLDNFCKYDIMLTQFNNPIGRSSAVETLKNDAAVPETVTDAPAVKPKKTPILVLTDEAYAYVGRNRNRLYNALGENGLRMALCYMKDQNPELTGEKDGMPALTADVAELLLQKFYITLDKSSRKNVSLDSNAAVACAVDGKPFWPQKWANGNRDDLGNYRLTKKADGTFIVEAVCGYCIRGIFDAEAAARKAGKEVKYPARFSNRETVEAKVAELNARHEERVQRFASQVKTTDRDPGDFFRGGAKVTRRGERRDDRRGKKSR
jgi:hypothetical protein